MLITPCTSKRHQLNRVASQGDPVLSLPEKGFAPAIIKKARRLVPGVRAGLAPARYIGMQQHQTPFIAGKPGGYASHLALQARLRAAALMLVASGAGLFGFTRSASLAAGGTTAMIPTFFLAVAVALVAVARTFWGRAAAAAVGARSERRVASVLARLHQTAVLHSVDLKAGGDSDHLLLGPKLVSVETKTGAGKVSYDGGKLYVGSKALRGDPVAQCRRQALAARDLLGTYCDAVVCVVDMTNSPFQVSSVVVCSLNDLSSVIGRFQDRIRPDQAWARAVELAPNCSTLHDKTTTSDNAEDRTEKPSRAGSTVSSSASVKVQPGQSPGPSQRPLRKLTPRSNIAPKRR